MTLQGELSLSSPMELCCFEGPDGGIGRIPLGEEPTMTKPGALFLPKALPLKVCMSLWPWQHETTRKRRRRRSHAARMESLVR